MVFCKEQFDRLLDERKALGAENEQLKIENKLLNEKIQFLMKKLFGKSSEKLNPDQMQLALEELNELRQALEATVEEPVEEETEPARRGKRKPLEARLPNDLPVETVVIVPDEVQANPELYKKIGEERLVELDVVPTRFFRREIIREKYKRRDDRRLPPVIAPAPKRLVENSMASVGLIVHIILSKFCDHLPLYRQEQIFKTRYGVELSRKVMGNWMYLTAQWLSLIHEALREEIRSAGCMQLDETPVQYIAPGTGRCSKGYLWGSYAPAIKTVIYDWYASRSAACLDKMLTGYSGLAQSDGYAAYESWYDAADAKQRDTITLAACWAHARRKFKDAETYPRSLDVLDEIRKLYQIEEHLREHPEIDRSRVRREQAPKILARIKAILDEEKPRQLPQSAFGKAVNYTLNLWDKLTVYVDHSELEIDTNLMENAIRPIAIGKKNWLFFGSRDSGQSAAVLYSLIETCRKQQINPADYLREVLTALPTMSQTEAPLWTPLQWNARRSDIDQPDPQNETA